jgi:hypothetical protein
MGRGSEGFWATGLRGSTGLRRKSTGTAGNRVSGCWIVSGSVGRSGFTQTGHGFSNRPGSLCLGSGGLRVTGLPEIGSPCSLRRVSSSRIHRILPSHSLSISRSPSISRFLSLFPPQSLDLSLWVTRAEEQRRRKKKGRRRRRKEKKEGKEKEEREGSGDAEDKGENEGKITEMPLTLNLTTFYPLL